MKMFSYSRIGLVSGILAAPNKHTKLVRSAVFWQTWNWFWSSSQTFRFGHTWKVKVGTPKWRNQDSQLYTKTRLNRVVAIDEAQANINTQEQTTKREIVSNKFGKESSNWWIGLTLEKKLWIAQLHVIRKDRFGIREDNLKWSLSD